MRYALPASDVRELVRIVTIVPLPAASPLIEGVINVRGRVVPVLDIRARFGLPPQPIAPSDHLILAHAGTRVVALRVDRALGLTRIAAEQIERPQTLVRGARYVGGIAKLPDGLVLIQDPATFLDDGESAAFDAAVSGGASYSGDGA
jgi:purine-binding chemotaxis protein CheW